MRKISTGVSALALAVAITMSPSASLAGSGFGLHVGPLFLRLPLAGSHGGRHRQVRQVPHERHARHATPTTRAAALTPPTERDVSAAPSALLYPTLGWVPVYTGIFSPAGAPWPFGFATIFDAAFGDEQKQSVAQPCQQNAAPDDLIGRIRDASRPNEAQREAMQQLTGAIAQANGYLRSTCPRTLPQTPIGRLQYMESQVDAMLMALEIVRVPLQKFEQSLSEEQQGRLRAAFKGHGAADCAVANAPKRPIEAIGQAIQPNDPQQPGLSDLEAASARAAKDLAAVCGAELPATPLARLQAVEARLDATWRAVQTLHVALSHFYEGLSDDQRKRFDALDAAALKQQG